MRRIFTCIYPLEPLFEPQEYIFYAYKALIQLFLSPSIFVIFPLWIIISHPQEISCVDPEFIASYRSCVLCVLDPPQFGNYFFPSFLFSKIFFFFLDLKACLIIENKYKKRVSTSKFTNETKNKQIGVFNFQFPRELENTEKTSATMHLSEVQASNLGGNKKNKTKFLTLNFPNSSYTNSSSNKRK